MRSRDRHTAGPDHLGDQLFHLLGLDSRAEAAYRTLLKHGGMSREDVLRAISDDRVEAGAALEALISASLVRTSWEEPDLLRPVSPEVGLSALLAEQQAEVLLRQQQLDHGRAALANMVADYAELRGPHHNSEVERLVGIDAIRYRMEELNNSVAFEMIAFSMGAQTEDTLETARAGDQKALDRGVALRGVYLNSVRNHPPTLAFARWLTEAGGEVRTVPTLPLRMVIFDRRTAVLPLDPENTREGAVILHGRGVLAALLALFEHVWAAATPFGEAVEKDGEGLSSSERELLRLLAEGLTDEAAARKLGVSLRTVRRMASRLMEALDARSRFQAGMQARERDWI